MTTKPRNPVGMRSVYLSFEELNLLILLTTYRSDTKGLRSTLESVRDRWLLAK